MEDSFSVSYKFAEKYVRFSKPEYIQLYIYVKYLLHKDGVFPKTEKVAAALDISPDRVIFILDFWVSRDELVYDESGYHFPENTSSHAKVKKAPAVHQLHKPSYSMTEINAAAAANQAVSGLFYQAETVLNKILTSSDMEMLYSFIDWLGLPVEVITMLLSYAAKKGKTGRRYLETLAIDWSERGIDTFEAAEAHVMTLEASDSAERKIRNILGIYDRALTSTEKKYITLWNSDDRITADLISLAYDRTIEHTGKLSWAYMNKILQSWAEAGYATPEDVNENDTKPVYTQTGSDKNLPKKSPFNNYKDTNYDYSKLEEQLLDIIDKEG